MKLYSYCILYDTGVAPNPYWGVSTLVICKPCIRRTADVGDWIVGLGSTNSPIGDISSSVVYAMQITDKMKMQAYDEYCQQNLPGKIPDWRSADFCRRVGDCIYDYSSGSEPKIRLSVHDERNRIRDLSGKHALLSNHFYYFGDKPQRLPKNLQKIAHPYAGHKSNANNPYLNDFVDWIENLGFPHNQPNGDPQLKSELSELLLDPDCRSKCAQRDLKG